VCICCEACEGCDCRLQAYRTPQWFVDDWLNDYYDIKSGAVRPNTSSSMGSCSRQAPAGAPYTTPTGRIGAMPAARNRSSDPAPTDDQPTAAGPAARENAAAAPASCIATSDYRFVYLGPKVQPAGIYYLTLAICSCHSSGAAEWLYTVPCWQ
jgi:hypothetical protein